jgi:ABC-type branched-subunit amino acid transport system substrate-binding protein
MTGRRAPNDVGDPDDPGEPKPPAGRRLQDIMRPRNAPPQSMGFDDGWKVGARNVAGSGFEPDEFEAAPPFLRSRDPIEMPETKSRRSGLLVALLRLAPVALVSATVALIAVWIYSESPAFDRGQVANPRTSTIPTARAADQGGAETTEVAAASPAAAVAPATPILPVGTGNNAGMSVRGITDRQIRFGMSAPFSGSAKELGHEMKLGIEAAFDLTNEGGGVYGRQLTLVAADDGYEPARTAEAMRELREKDEVFGVIGNVGTPTAMVSLPYALEHRMLFFGAFTGANLLRRDPPDRYVFNYRASYAEETDAVVRYLMKVRRVRPEQIAVFAQQDAYGDAGFAGVAKAIRTLRLDDAGILRLNYRRNTVDVDDAVAQLRAHRLPIKAIVMVATYRAAAKFIEKTRDLYPTMIYTNVSFVGSTALAEELMLLGPRYATGVIVTQVVPAVDSYATVILEYKSALSKYFPGETSDYVSLEGFVAARVLVEALKRAGPQLDTEKLVDSLESLRNLDLGLGTSVSFGRTEHQAVHKVWGTELDANGRYQAIDLQ